jgi:hypothetical protein
MFCPAVCRRTVALDLAPRTIEFIEWDAEARPPALRSSTRHDRQQSVVRLDFTTKAFELAFWRGDYGDRVVVCQEEKRH